MRRLHEIFVSDEEDIVEVAAVNAYVDSIDKSTGQRVRPCLVSVRCSRGDFEKLDSARDQLISDPERDADE